MSKYDPRIDAYIEKIPGYAQPVMQHLRGLVHAACPAVEETWKWSFPHFMYKGAILCSMAAFKEHCTFGFWKAALIEDTDHALSVTDRESMGHLGKIRSVKDLPKDAVLKKYIKAAMKLNDDGVKLPARKKPSDDEKEALTVPAYLQAGLNSTEQAKNVFTAFSYSDKKEYIMWLEEAKTTATRDRRLAQALTWLAEGKSRNWKYKDC